MALLDPLDPLFDKVRDKLQSLPVFGMINDVVGDVLAGKVTVLAAPTGSGKSMLLPGALADATQDQVLVLVPRRLLAVDAARNVANLSETMLGQEVGFAIGQMNGEKSIRSHNTKVLYATYGYALRSGLINTAKTVVLDEVHEGDEQISLARAVLHRRKKQDPSLRILEMSATVNAQAQAGFWDDIAETKIHLAEGAEHKCKLIHEVPPRKEDSERSIEDVVMDLLEGKDGNDDRPIDTNGVENFAEFMEQSDTPTHKPGRNGIALFRSSVREVENSVEKLQKMLESRGITDVDVVGIHGGTPSDERDAAALPPAPGRRKIIVGTNVIESGVNLLWLDAGVSDGMRKVPYCRADTGAEALVAENLPQAGLTQQMGRINRNPKETGFDEGVFILYAKDGFAKRPKENGPAIERESLLAPAFHAACLGYDPSQLKWDVSSAHARSFPTRLEEARQDLLRLELINDDWSLTEDGKFINHLPISPQTGAMLNEAHRLDLPRVRSQHKEPHLMRDTVIIAALAEAKNLKLDSREGYGGDTNGGSDPLSAMAAYHEIVRQARRRGVFQSVIEHSDETYLANATEEELKIHSDQRDQLKKLCARRNMTLQGFVQVTQLVTDIFGRLEKISGIAQLMPHSDDAYEKSNYDELKRCLLNGGANRLFQFEHGGLRDLLRDDGDSIRGNGKPFRGYEIATSSIVSGRSPAGTLVTGELREVADKKPRYPEPRKPGEKGKKEKARTDPLLVVSNATVIPPKVFITWAKARAERVRYAENPNLMVTEGELDGSKLSGRYAGKAPFEIPVPAEARGDASFLNTANAESFGHRTREAQRGNGRNSRKGR